MTYTEVKKKAAALRELGETSIYLEKDDPCLPWGHVTKVEPGGSHRLDIATSVVFHATCPETKLDLRWFFDIEGRDANGKGHYEIDAAACMEVTGKLPAEAKETWRSYLLGCAEKVRAKGMEWRAIADKQMTDAAKLADCASA